MGRYNAYLHITIPLAMHMSSSLGRIIKMRDQLIKSKLANLAK